MSDRPVKIGLIQMRCASGPDAAVQNLEQACQDIQIAADLGAKIVCLPELFLSPYFCQTEDHVHFALAEPIPGPTTQRLATLAAEREVVIIASLFERRAPGIYHNTAAVIDADGTLLGKYRKMHIPDDPLYYEKFYFTPGDLGFRTFQTRYAKIGVLICWDQWFPEAARLTALQGAEVLCYPTAIGWHPGEKRQYGTAQHESWELMQRSHAVANGCFVAAVNRTGHEGPAAGGIEFWGQSFISDASGQILGRGAVSVPEVLVTDIDLNQIDATRTHWPFFRDRRIDAYAGLTERFLQNRE